jgi:DNA-binding NarL/FixJ family response regulator
MPLRCVIIDDDASFRREIRALLEDDGIEVVGGAASASDAVLRVAELRPDVVLIDIELGGESGLELARRLHEDAGCDAHAKSILISTHDQREYADLIEASPAIGFVAKLDLSAAAIREMLASVDRSDLGGANPSGERRGT